VQAALAQGEAFSRRCPENLLLEVGDPHQGDARLGGAAAGGEVVVETLPAPFAASGTDRAASLELGVAVSDSSIGVRIILIGWKKIHALSDRQPIIEMSSKLQRIRRFMTRPSV
jgi:hypothetical protein